MSPVHEAAAAKKTSIVKVTVNLAVTCLISGIIIAGAYFITHPVAVQKEKEMAAKAMRELVPQATDFSPVSGEDNLTEASANGKAIAYIVQVEPKGYGGAIKMQVAVDTSGKVIDFTITGSNETPGLGSKASEEPFKSQFPGKTSQELVVTKDAANSNDIDAITGATITSRAVTKGVKEAVDEAVQYMGEANK